MADADADRPGRRTGAVELIAELFDAEHVTALRHEVARCAAKAGLAGPSLEDFVLAVNELVTNAVRHGGGRGRLRLWQTDERLVCEVTDEGPGIAEGVRNGWDRPSVDTVGGWGMWLAHEMSATMQVVTGPGGTTVRISAVTSADGADRAVTPD